MNVQKPAHQQRSTEPPASDHVPRQREANVELAAALARATLALGRAGQPTEALRIAARGYVAVRRDHPAAARRIDAAMHALALMPEQPTTNEKEASND